MRTKCAALGGVGSCFCSDLEHDKTVIRANPLHAFVWIVTPHATHMMRVGTDSDALVNTSRPTIESTTFGQFTRNVIECYDAEMLRAGFVRAYVWEPAAFDGKLHVIGRFDEGPEIYRAELLKRIADQVRHAAIELLESKLKIAREDVAFSPSNERYAREAADLVEQIEHVREWSRP
jgi:hypothetical protein